MRSAFLFPLLVGIAITLFVVNNVASSKAEQPAGIPAAEPQAQELISDIEHYEDLDYGFSMAIPAGWRPIIADGSKEQFEDLEPGYAIGFESPRQGEQDRFADYILVEILPGTDSGLFVTDGKNRQAVSIDGRAAFYDKLMVDSTASDLTEVDLTIFQAELTGVGYTVGLYAIGEPSRESLMSAAFEIMVRTFGVNAEPFPLS